MITNVQSREPCTHCETGICLASSKQKLGNSKILLYGYWLQGCITACDAQRVPSGPSIDLVETLGILCHDYYWLVDRFKVRMLMQHGATESIHFLVCVVSFEVLVSQYAIFRATSGSYSLVCLIKNAH